ncbi:MAG: hypothetical protein HQ592_16575 [Planctomycetes bacterium]|nr:hypothetical protein [Planctomycetota bacterium]
MAATARTLPSGQLSVALVQLEPDDDGITQGAAPPCSLVWELADPWAREPDLNGMKDVILSSRNAPRRPGKACVSVRIEWPQRIFHLEATEFDLGPAFAPLTEATADFIRQRELQQSIVWLQTAAPGFFPGASFEIDLLPAEDPDNDLLALRVYSSFDTADFRKRRHHLSEAMLEADHKALYEILSVFQRRVHGSGWQAFSSYSALSAE